MKTYRKVRRQTQEVEKIICDSCGREIPLREDYLSIQKTWGYGSRKDGETTNFDICEDCFDRWTAGMRQQAAK